MCALELLRERLSGKARVRFHGVPSWAQCASAVDATTLAQHNLLEALSKGQSELLRDIASAWAQGNFAKVHRCLQRCLAYFDPTKPHILAYFVGLGGIDLFVTLLCDLNMPDGFERNTSDPLSTWRSQPLSHLQLLNATELILRILTELLVCHNELGWYCYDRHPGLFFRLLELAKAPDLRLVSLMALEHLLLCVGPVLEISKVPALQELIRAEDDGMLAAVCRVVSLLTVSDIVLDQQDSTLRHSPFPENILPLQRVQRVVDSNVLWLIGEKGLVKRLIALCEMKGEGSLRPALGAGGHPLQSSAYFLPDSILEEIQAGVAATYSDLGEPTVPRVTFESFLAWEAAGGERRQVGGSGDSDIGGGMVSESGEDAAPSTAGGPLLDNVAATPLRRALDTIMVPRLDDDAESSASVDAAGSSIDFSWFIGCMDVRQRWRLRDLTLSEELDDTRVLLGGFGPVSDEGARREFQKQKRVFWDFLQPMLPIQLIPGGEHIVANAQSEVMFVLNVMLSTFFVGDVWRIMKECDWVGVASRFYERVFGSHDGRPTISPYLEQLGRMPGLQQLPRFLTPAADGREKKKTSESQVQQRHVNFNNNIGDSCVACGSSSSASSNIADGAMSAGERLFKSIRAGEDKEAYRRFSDAGRVVDDEEGISEKDHNHEIETIRKLELLRSMLEFWNTQDRVECSMLKEGDISCQSIPLALKVAMTLASRDEDCCVETMACHALEGYLRCFSFGFEGRTLPAAPQKIVGDVLMSSILEHRVYNATYVPGLSGSLFPSKRIESVFSLLGELVRYHYGNLKILQDYIVGDVDLSHLNGSHSTALPHTRQLHVGSERMEQLIRLPPLDREEHEPFAKVLLRRISRHGCDTNLFLRSLLISLTPGLRSKINYMWKPVTDDTVDARELLSVSSRVGDIVTCCPNRFSYVGTCSRSFVVLLAERQRKARALVRGGMTGGDGAAHTPEGVSSVTGPASLLSPDATLWDMLQMLLRVPHRYSVEERPFPQFFDDYDRAIVMGSIDLPPVGPPPHLAVPLFSEEGCHASLVRIEEVLFQKPHELVYGILGPLHAERFHSTGRLCGVTTCIFVFARVARLGGASAVRDVLENIKPLARVGYEKWREHRYATSHCARGKKRRESEGAGNNSVGDHSVPDSRCHCQAGDGTLRCSSFLLHGHCAPRSAVALYHMNYGGCFFCNMFRLLCCWVGHYGACQRYVETLFYCTEVPFAELKCVMLYLFRLLPDFFMLEAP